MSGLFLSRIDLTNFRTFGDFSVELVATPGLTLVVGPNGLGKSSFFDAIEWCLTGKVRRFDTYLTAALTEASYLTRRDAPPDSHQVKLTFNDGAPILRASDHSPDAAGLERLLKTPEWGAQIDDLSTYLAFTHFLGQAAQQRFTSRDRGEQWQSLKGPSGIDRLEEVREALRGRTTQNAFRRRVDFEKAKVEQAAARFADWQASRARHQRLREAASASGVVSGLDLQTQISDLLRRLQTIDNQRDRGASADEAIPGGGSPSLTLIALRERIVEAQETLAARASALTGLGDLPERYTALLAAADPDAPGQQAARREMDEAGRAAAEAAMSLRAAEAVRRQKSAAVSQADAFIKTLDAVRVDLELAAKTDEQITRIASELATLRVALSARQGDLAQVDEIIAGNRRLRADISALGTAATVAQELVGRARETAELDAISRSRADALAEARTKVETVREGQSALEAEHEALVKAVAAAERGLAEARARASDMASAIARIAAHLGPHDESCPICATPFDPGDLKLLAERAAAGQDAELAVQEAAHVRLLERQAIVLQELASIALQFEQMREATIRAQSTVDAAESHRSALQVALDAPPGADLMEIATRQEADIMRAVADLQRTFDNRQPALRQAIDRRAQLVTEMTELNLRAGDLSSENEALERELRSARERLAARNYADVQLTSVESQLAERRLQADAAQTALREAELAVTTTTALEQSARARAEAASEALSLRAAARDAAKRNADALEQQWSALDLTDKPMGSALAQARSAVAINLDTLGRLLEEQKSLAAANQASIEHQELQELVAKMERDGGSGAADDPQKHEVVLETTLSKTRADLTLSEAAWTAVNALADRLKSEAIDFSTRFLKPLNDLIDDFNEALLSAPGESVRFNAEHHVDRTIFDMRLRFRDQLDDALYNTELPPQVVLSEGQLAANGFSILCSASTAYPWSRWRALLLDDPLQHNDIIHAAAFVDVMRNLVELEGYQLIMSSHDRAEAEFIARKFDAAQLPCTIVSLTAPSKKGVRYEPARYNPSARAKIEGNLAQSG